MTAEPVFRYPYMLGSLALLALFLVAFAIYREQRKLMLLSGLLSAPFSFASIMFVPDYWAPVRVVEFGTGLEDLLFSFATGGLAWLLAIGPFRQKIAVRLEMRRLLLGYTLLSTAGIAAASLSWKHGFSPMGATLLSVLALGAGLCLVRAGHLPIFFTGAIAFAAIYWMWIAAMTLVAPSFLSHWSDENLWGIRLFLGIPLEEMLWAAAFGAVWPLFMAFLFNTRWVREESRLKGPGVGG